MGDEKFITGKARDTVTCSKAIDWFGGEMMKKLWSNRHKAHWSEADLQYLWDRFKEEVEELNDALENGSNEDIIKECADCANFLMFIADNLRDKDG